MNAACSNLSSFRENLRAWNRQSPCKLDILSIDGASFQVQVQVQV